MRFHFRFLRPFFPMLTLVLPQFTPICRLLLAFALSPMSPVTRTMASASAEDRLRSRKGAHRFSSSGHLLPRLVRSPTSASRSRPS